MKIAVFLVPCEEGGYTVYVPSLPGCISEGETVDEALANIREAFELYVEPTEGDLIPEEDEAILRELELDWCPQGESPANAPAGPSHAADLHGPRQAGLFDPAVAAHEGKPG